jgi:SpoVK/Ycf46/Vps4 family AAA+-type ATPase
VPAEVANADFAADEALRRDLDVLLARCRYRAAPANRVPGVRALLSGPSGAGKTLACSWLATRLCLPLFRVDLSSVVSKYIGETEENIARLLDRAEAGDMVLLLDEADSLFASRTETQDSSDRFANNQTNYLLSRIENFDGIAILTSNGPERIDAAFTRRLDQVIPVPLPAPPQRRAIWLAHLAGGHALTAGELNRLSGLVDLAGGHLRNIAQTARVLAEPRAVSWADLVRAVELEYRKLGRSVPGGLVR